MRFSSLDRVALAALLLVLPGCQGAADAPRDAGPGSSLAETGSPPSGLHIASPPDSSEYRRLVSDTRTLARGAMERYAEGDWLAFARGMESALALRPDHPELLYNSAAGRARAGQIDSAFVHLERFAAFGLSAPFDQDEDFAAAREDPRWDPLAVRVSENGAPSGTADRLFTLPAPELLPEGIAYDPVSGAYFVGGVRGRSVWRRPVDGDASLYLERSIVPFGSVFGLAVDPSRRHLFVCTAWMSETPGATEETVGSTAVHVFDLEAERWIGYHALPADGERRILNDLSVDEEGNAYLSDNQTGRIYRLEASRIANLDTGPGASGSTPPSPASPAVAEPASGLVELPILPLLVSPQGIAYVSSRSPEDGGTAAEPAYGRGTLYVADYSLGIVEIRLEAEPLSGSGSRSFLRARRLSPVPSACLIGIDGLARHGRDLVAIQNGVRPHRVLQISLSPGGDRIESVRTLLAAHPDFDEPTLGVVVGDRMHLVANSLWPSLASDGGVKEGVELTEPTVLSLSLR